MIHRQQNIPCFGVSFLDGIKKNAPGAGVWTSKDPGRVVAKKCSSDSGELPRVLEEGSGKKQTRDYELDWSFSTDLKQKGVSLAENAKAPCHLVYWKSIELQPGCCHMCSYVVWGQYSCGISPIFSANRMYLLGVFMRLWVKKTNGDHRF